MKNLNKNSALSLFVASCALSLVLPIVALAAGPSAINLGSAGNFTILAKSGAKSTNVLVKTNKIS